MDNGLGEPLVTVAIVNWNYARFVGEAIASVKAQSYGNFECLVLDNGSSDGSPEIIRECVANDTRFALFSVPDNLGHLGGALWLLDKSKGEFITFLDADDVLLPDYVAVHVQAHLASIFPVSFSTSNCREVNEANVVLAGSSTIISFRWDAAVPCLPDNYRPLRIAAIGDGAFEGLAAAIRFSPAHVKGWGWCQGSSIMFRRIMLERLRPTGVGAAVFGGVDAYFAPLLNAMTGFLVIDLPLSHYRIHGTNDYTVLPGLAGVRNGTPTGEAQGDRVLVLAMELLLSEPQRVLDHIWPPSRYWQILEVTVSVSRFPTLPEVPGAIELLGRNFDRLVVIFKRRRVIRELRRITSFRSMVRIVRAGGRFRPAALLIVGWVEFRIRVAKLLMFIGRVRTLMRPHLAD